MKILITGGAGFIGRKLVQRLVLDGYDVTVMDNHSRGDINLLPKEIKQKINFVLGDTQNIDLVNHIVSKVDTIIHLAAGSSFFMYEEKPIKETQATINGFINIVEAMRQFGVRKIIYASTSAVYEGNDLPYREEMEIDPPDLKALSKKVNEDFARLYSQQYRISAIGLRPLNVYGEGEFSKGEYANTISLFIWAMVNGQRPVVWGDGSQTRDFTYVDDVVDAFVLALEKDLSTQVINIGTGKETSLNELVEIINKRLDTKLEPIYKDIPVNIYAKRLCADVTRAQIKLGFRPKTPLSLGVEKVISEAKKLNRPELALKQNFILERTANSTGGNWSR